MGKGGGNSTVTQYTSSLPQWSEPYHLSLMDRAQELSTRPYQAYQGQRIADQSAGTTAGMNMAQQFAQSGSPYLNNANSLTNSVAQGAMGLQNYVAGGVDNTYTGPAAWANGQFAADQVGTDKFGTAERDEYMSPYMSAVTEAAQREATENAQIEQAQIKAQQGTTGAFGGSRGAIQQQLAANAAQNRISDIGVEGRQAAFENAQQQFERDQGRGLQAQLANQAKNLEALGMGESSRQFGYAQGEAGRQAAAELGMNAQFQTEQLRQAGKTLGLQGLQLAGNMGGQLADLQKLSDDMMISRYQTQMGVGQMSEDRQQRALDMRYEDFQNQLNWPQQQLSFMSGMLGGPPSGTSSTTTQQGPAINPMAGPASSMLGASALYNIGR